MCSSDLEPGAVTVARVSEKLELSDDALTLVAEAGLTPGSRAEILGRTDDGMQVRTDRGTHHVPDTVGGQLFVTPA